MPCDARDTVRGMPCGGIHSSSNVVQQNRGKNRVHRIGLDLGLADIESLRKGGRATKNLEIKAEDHWRCLILTDSSVNWYSFIDFSLRSWNQFKSIVVQTVWNHESEACRAQWYASKAWDPWTTHDTSIFGKCPTSCGKPVWTCLKRFPKQSFSKGFLTGPDVSCSAIFPAFAVELHLEMAC